MSSRPSSPSWFRVLGLQSRVTRQLLKRAWLIGMVASALVSVYQGFDRHREQQAELHEHFDAMARYATPALVESLWAFNTTQTRVQLEGLIHEHSVSAVVLKQPGLPDERYGQPLPSGPVYEREVSLVHFENGTPHRLGSLHLLHDLRADHDQLWRDIGVSSLGNAVVILLVILIALATYHTFVQQRLVRIVDELSRTEPPDLIAASQEATSQPPVRDEIDELAQAIVQLKAKGGAALALLEQKNRTLQDTLTALTEAKSLLRTVIDTAPMRIFWKDRHSRYLGCNRLFAQDASMASPQDLVGKTDDAMPWAAQAELYRADDRAVMQGGSAKLNYEEPQNHADGSVIWVRTSKVPMQDYTGQPVGVLGIYDDITQHKQAEKKLAEQLSELLRWQDLMLDREDRVLELKGEVNELLARLGEPPRYENTLPLNSHKAPP